MRERPFYFVVVLFLFFNVEIFSQRQSPQCIKLPINYTSLANFDFENVLKLDGPKKDSSCMTRMMANDSTLTHSSHPLIVLSASHYREHLSFFCDKELLFEKRTAIPLRFRLGSLAYVNYLERKPNALKLD